MIEGMKLWRSVKNHLLPWRGNTHRPHILRRQWLVALLGLAMISELVILGGSIYKAGPDVFLAAVVRSDVISHTVEARVGEGSLALTESGLLDEAAQAKAEDMAARGYFSHVGPDGEEPWVWLERAGYQYVYAGENLAVRFNDSKDVVDAWMASPAHRANIVKPQYTEIGVGLADGTYKGGPATFVVQYFGSPAQPVAAAAPAPEPAPEPVAASVPATVAETPANSAVAGAQTATPSVPQTFIKSATRAIAGAFDGARDNATWVLAFIAGLLVTVLALTFFIRIQVQPTDLLLPGLAVALIAITLLAANSSFLPATTQTASVAGPQSGDIGAGVAVERANVAFPEAQAQ